MQLKLELYQSSFHPTSQTKTGLPSVIQEDREHLTASQSVIYAVKIVHTRSALAFQYYRHRFPLFFAVEEFYGTRVPGTNVAPFP